MAFTPLASEVDLYQMENGDICGNNHLEMFLFPDTRVFFFFFFPLT